MSGESTARWSWSSQRRLIGAFAVGFIGALVSVTAALVLAILILPASLAVGIVAALVRGDRYGFVVTLAGSLVFMVVSAVPFVGDPEVNLLTLLSFFAILYAGAYTIAFLGIGILRLRQERDSEPIEDDGWPDDEADDEADDDPDSEPDDTSGRDPGSEPNAEPNPAD